MTAVPVKDRPTPQDVIDRLIADVGLRPVLLALAARLLRRPRPPDPRADLRALSPHLQRDLGLPPCDATRRPSPVDPWAGRGPV